ncbi:hypothetical protein NKH56_21840, partial [Mesorhizobium sp. M1076]|uniref:hypothetical protein n=1 Tax=Mesorhizobium sp. M1076 TaxID=2957054 RepID=UPI003336EAC6
MVASTGKFEPSWSANPADCTLRCDILQDSHPTNADSRIALDKSTPAADHLAGRHLADPGIDPGTRLLKHFIRERG